MDQGIKAIFFQYILFTISFLILYVKVIRKRDNNRNEWFLKQIFNIDIGPERDNLVLYDQGKHLRSCRDGQFLTHTLPLQGC